jgi:hypothetical protein
MNRLVIRLTPDGNIDRICSDEKIEVLFVDAGATNDRVYLFSSVKIGWQHVQREIDGHQVGHIDDGKLSGKRPVKLPPSMPRPVKALT